MNFKFILALLLLVENNGRYLLIDITDPLSPVDNIQSTGVNSYARSRRLEFQKKNFKNFGKQNFRRQNIANTESGKDNSLAQQFLNVIKTPMII